MSVQPLPRMDAFDLPQSARRPIEREGRSRAHLVLVQEPALIVPSPVLPRIAQGDEQAVRTCVAQYGNLVWSFVRRWSPVEAEQEDLVQEIFIDLWRSASRFDQSRASEAGWIAMIARRRLIDRQRRQQRAPEYESLGDEHDRSPEEDPDDQSTDRAERARAMVQALPEAQRTMLELSFLHGHTHEEIAKVTNTPLGTVKSHIRRGLARARALLGEEPVSDADRTGHVRSEGAV